MIYIKGIIILASLFPISFSIISNKLLAFFFTTDVHYVGIFIELFIIIPWTLSFSLLILLVFYKQLGLLATMCFILHLLTLNGSFHFDIHSPNVQRFLWSFSDSLIVFTTQNNLVSSANLAIPLSTRWFQVIYKYVKKALILYRILGDPTSYLSSLWEMAIYFYSSFSILYPIAYLQEGLPFYSMAIKLIQNQPLIMLEPLLLWF